MHVLPIRVIWVADLFKCARDKVYVSGAHVKTEGGGVMSVHQRRVISGTIPLTLTTPGI